MLKLNAIRYASLILSFILPSLALSAGKGQSSRNANENPNAFQNLPIAMMGYLTGFLDNSDRNSLMQLNHGFLKSITHSDISNMIQTGTPLDKAEILEIKSLPDPDLAKIETKNLLPKA